MNERMNECVIFNGPQTEETLWGFLSRLRCNCFEVRPYHIRFAIYSTWFSFSFALFQFHESCHNFSYFIYLLICFITFYLIYINNYLINLLLIIFSQLPLLFSLPFIKDGNNKSLQNLNNIKIIIFFRFLYIIFFI